MWDFRFWSHKETGTLEEKQSVLGVPSAINHDEEAGLDGTQRANTQLTTNHPSMKAELGVMVVSTAVTAFIDACLKYGLELNPVIEGTVSAICGAFTNITLRRVAGINPSIPEALLGANDVILVYAGANGIGTLLEQWTGSKLAADIFTGIVPPLAQAGAVQRSVRQAPPKENTSKGPKR